MLSILIALEAFLVIGAGWALLLPQPPAPLRHPTSAEVRALQTQADAACRCARRRGGSPWREDCWAGFNRNVEQFEHGGASSACFEESVSFVCFGPGMMGEPCISTEREYGGCSDEESRRLAAEARARHEHGCSDD